MKKLPEKWRAVLQKKAFAHFATVMSDGWPQVTPVWVDFEGDSLLVNSARGRVKDQNIARDQRVALSVTDPDNPYSALTLRGTVTEITEQGADAHIDKMAKKYLGQDKYPYRQPGEVRVLYRVRIESMRTS